MARGSGEQKRGWAKVGKAATERVSGWRKTTSGKEKVYLKRALTYFAAWYGYKPLHTRGNATVIHGTSLAAQWLRICLLVWGDASLIPALGRFRVPRGNWAQAPWLLSPHLEPVLGRREATTVKSRAAYLQSSPHSPQQKKARMQQRRPSAARN